MDFFKALFFGDEPAGMAKSEGDELGLEVKVEGELPLSTSAVFVTALAKRRGENTRIAVAAKFAWHRLKHGSEERIENTSNAYFFSAADLFAKVRVTAVSLEGGAPSYATFGPIELDPKLKGSLYELAAHSEGLLLPLRAIKSQRRHLPLERPTLYVFDSYLKVVGQRGADMATLRVAYADAFGLRSASTEASLTLELDGGRLADFAGVDGRTVDLVFESALDRDRAAVAVSIFGSLLAVRNAVVLAKIAPLLTAGSPDEDLAKVDIVREQQREIESLRRLRSEELQERRTLEEELAQYKQAQVQQQVFGGPFGKPHADRAAFEGSFMARDTIVPEQRHLPADIDMSFSQVLDQ